jgi:predicted DNA-binding transcriptional regulator YafY
MAATSARLLRLVALLSSRPSWTNTELADRMEVTERTVRRDILRLRDLGYGIESEAGRYGGYRLGGGTRVAPLSLDDEEALAVAIALREAALSGVLGGDQSVYSAMLKLQQVLPRGIAERLDGFGATFEHTPRAESDQISPHVLLQLATACRNEERVRFTYQDMRGRTSVRDIDPHRLVRTRHRWYLVALDVERAEWRTFRADRVVRAEPTGARAEIEEAPDAAAMVARMLVSDYPVYTTIRISLPLEQARQLVPPHRGTAEAETAESTLVTLGGIDAAELAREILGLPLTVETLGPQEVIDAMRAHLQHVLSALRQ